MRLIRRRDRIVRCGEVVRPGGETSLPILLIEGEPFPPEETAGYLLADASAAELAELHRGGYALLRAIDLPRALRSPPAHPSGGQVRWLGLPAPSPTSAERRLSRLSSAIPEEARRLLPIKPVYFLIPEEE